MINIEQSHRWLIYSSGDMKNVCREYGNMILRSNRLIGSYIREAFTFWADFSLFDRKEKKKRQKLELSKSFFLCLFKWLVVMIFRS